MECHVEGTRQQIAGVVDQPVDVPWRDHHVGAILGNAFAVDALYGGVEVYHSGNPQCDHRHPQRPAGEFRTVICHAAAGGNAAVTHLNCRAQSGEFRTRQSIYRHHCRRPDLFADRFDQFCRLPCRSAPAHRRQAHRLAAVPVDR